MHKITAIIYYRCAPQKVYPALIALPCSAASFRSSGAPAGRDGCSGGELCSGSPIAEPVPRRRVSANFNKASRIPAFGSVRVFGYDGLWTGTSRDG